MPKNKQNRHIHMANGSIIFPPVIEDAIASGCYRSYTTFVAHIFEQHSDLDRGPAASFRKIEQGTIDVSERLPRPLRGLIPEWPLKYRGSAHGTWRLVEMFAELNDVPEFSPVLHHLSDLDRMGMDLVMAGDSDGALAIVSSFFGLRSELEEDALAYRVHQYLYAMALERCFLAVLYFSKESSISMTGSAGRYLSSSLLPQRKNGRYKSSLSVVIDRIIRQIGYKNRNQYAQAREIASGGEVSASAVNNKLSAWSSGRQPVSPESLHAEFFPDEESRRNLVLPPASTPVLASIFTHLANQCFREGKDTGWLMHQCESYDRYKADILQLLGDL
jgi:hypothetical protein